MKFKKPSLYLLICLPLIISGCGGNQKTNNTLQYINSIKKTTKPNEKPKTIDLNILEITPPVDIKVIKKRNPFNIQAVASSGAGISGKAGKLSLMGIFHVGGKKWAVIRSNGKIYKVTAGEKIDSSQTVTKVTSNSVTIIKDDGEEQTTFTLTLQEQEK